MRADWLLSNDSKLEVTIRSLKSNNRLLVNIDQYLTFYKLNADANNFCIGIYAIVQ